MTCKHCGGELIRLDELERKRAKYEGYRVCAAIQILRCEECSEEHDHADTMEQVMKEVEIALNRPGISGTIKTHGRLYINHNPIKCVSSILIYL